jgi:hypothetical protein
MENCILTSDCSWCGIKYIKEHIGVSHGCEEEKNAKNVAVAAPEQEQVINLFARR